MDIVEEDTRGRRRHTLEERGESRFMRSVTCAYARAPPYRRFSRPAHAMTVRDTIEDEPRIRSRSVSSASKGRTLRARSSRLRGRPLRPCRGTRAARVGETVMTRSSSEPGSPTQAGCSPRERSRSSTKAPPLGITSHAAPVICASAGRGSARRWGDAWRVASRLSASSKPAPSALGGPVQHLEHTGEPLGTGSELVRDGTWGASSPAGPVVSERRDAVSQPLVEKRSKREDVRRAVE